MEFEPEDRRVPEVAEEVESEDEEEEDVQIKYPYERKDAYQDLQERIERRLNDSGDEKLEQKAKVRLFFFNLQLKLFIPGTSIAYPNEPITMESRAKATAGRFSVEATHCWIDFHLRYVLESIPER